MPMRDSALAANTYHAHRERQRRRILDAAERLFDERGIERVNMAEIIAACGLRTSTLYQYFANKDEIVWAILGEVLTGFEAQARQAGTIHLTATAPGAGRGRHHDSGESRLTARRTALRRDSGRGQRVHGERSG